MSSKAKEDQAVTNFREYLRIKTVHPDPDYETALVFLKRIAEEIGLPFKRIKVHPGRDIVVITWEGQEPNLQSIMLNSHTDVVPVYPVECWPANYEFDSQEWMSTLGLFFSSHSLWESELRDLYVRSCSSNDEEWKVDPFSAHKFENGDIYARGTQDMKSVGIQYLEAVRKLKQKGIQLKRTIHITFVPDEEIGGQQGMKLFVQHEEFKKLNVGFGLDEGLANPTEKFTVFYGERCPWWVRVTCHGNPGHASRFIENTAAEKFRKVINSFLDFRGEEEKKLKTHGCLKLGDVTTLNMTMLEGGIQCNVVPNKLSVYFDIRIPPTVDMEKFEVKIQEWCKNAGEEVTYECLQKTMIQTVTKTDDSNKWWKLFSETCEQLGMQLETEIFPAATDIRFLREIGLPAFGFSPMNNTPILLHDHNEFLNENVFLKGIELYCGIIPALGNFA